MNDDHILRLLNPGSAGKINPSSIINNIIDYTLSMYLRKRYKNPDGSFKCYSCL